MPLSIQLTEVNLKRVKTKSDGVRASEVARKLLDASIQAGGIRKAASCNPNVTNHPQSVENTFLKSLNQEGSLAADCGTPNEVPGRREAGQARHLVRDVQDTEHRG